jgi:diadenosine tetraphosphatase ApaH/serine/threonine PP2A family protein phosphatase
MKYAILSDVHGNLEALTAVLEDMENRLIKKTVFLGDAIGYGANPEECFNLIDKKSNLMILGNHDLAIAAGSGIDDLNEDAAIAVKWTTRVIKEQSREKIKALPLDHIDNGLHFVHGSPYKPIKFNYILTEKDAERGFSESKGNIIFVGHSHIPKIFIEVEYSRTFTGEVRKIKEERATELQIESKYRYIINVGSVGQPRDGDSRAAYGIYDSDEGTYFLIRVPYNVEGAAEKIKKAGLPEGLSNRLRSGR